ncbi:uncharacterized protein N7511_008098 [Penicillium nucicola]|uniref:uncharacterized protein n=1 Tax=Penicillium nucicola TaxID=1850975 RepID=UPI002544F23B|nr:uncharacterized protein N7511_008098 [Penicillium nucicola]KAJ5753945.1 hypothetical protein N7511_008098 [Penicillium nucicola]
MAVASKATSEPPPSTYMTGTPYSPTVPISIPTHVSVPGNEATDSSAKYAALQLTGGATGEGIGADKPTIRLAAAAKRTVRARI